MVTTYIIELEYQINYLVSKGGVVENGSEKSTPLSDDVIPTPRHIEFSTKAELNLSCCVLMLDVLLKQVSSFARILDVANFTEMDYMKFLKLFFESYLFSSADFII